MNFTPREHQHLGINHLLSNDESALFAGIGLGKTAMVLAALSQLIADGACRGALIIAPLRVSLFTWPQEVAQWDQFRWMRIVSLRTPEGVAAWEAGEACIYTLNYESLFIPRNRKVVDEFGDETTEEVDYGVIDKLVKGKRVSQMPVDTVVWDELHYAKNAGSKRIRKFAKYRNKFKRHWGMTGSPTPESYIDLFAQIKLLDGGKTFGKVMKHFKDQFMAPENMHIPSQYWKWVVRPECIDLIERKVSHMALTLRSEDWLDIPPTEVIDVPVVIPAKAKAVYKKLEKKMILMFNQSRVRAVNKAVLAGKLLQILGGAVYAESVEQIILDLDRLLDEDYEVPEKTKVVTEIHDGKTKALLKLWKSEGQKPMLVATQFIHERQRITRDIPGAVEFHSSKLSAWDKGEIPMMVCHPKQMAEGLNMQAGGSRVCWFSMAYSRKDYDQLNGRVVRTGQKYPTKVFRLLVQGTIDDAIVAAVESKGGVQSRFLQVLKNLNTLAKVT